MFSPGRYDVLQYALAGLKKSGLLLVEFDGTQFAPLFTPRPVGSVDDIGLFIIVPKIAQRFHISLDKAIEIFFNGSAALAIMCGLLGVALLYWQSSKQLFLGFLSIIGASLFALSMTRDVQLMYSFVVIGSLPLLLFLLKQHPRSSALYPIFFLMGFLYGCINYIRLNASLGMSVWLLASVWLLPEKQKSFGTKCALTIFFLVGLAAPGMYVENLQYASHQFLRKQNANYQATAHAHPIWHTIYAGFGYSNFLNRKELRIADEMGLEVAALKHKAPIDFSNPLYDNYLKEAVVELFWQEPFFIITTLATKIGILVYYVLRYGNVALIALLLQFKWWEFLPYLLALSVSGMIPLLYVPCGSYVLGFITLIQLYAMILINDFIDDRRFPMRLRMFFFWTFAGGLICNFGIAKIIMSSLR